MDNLGLKGRTVIVELLIIVFVSYSLINLQFGFIKFADFTFNSNMLFFFSAWSNVLPAICAVFSLYYLHKEEKLPRLLAAMKLASVMMLTMSFLVIVLVIAPLKGWAMLFDFGGMIFLHLIVPILGALDFLFLADMYPLEKKDVIISLTPMMLYATMVLLTLIIAGNDDLAPYTFMRIHSQPVYETILWMVGLFALGYALSYGFWRLVRKTNPSMR